VLPIESKRVEDTEGGDEELDLLTELDRDNTLGESTGGVAAGVAPSTKLAKDGSLQTEELSSPSRVDVGQYPPLGAGGKFEQGVRVLETENCVALEEGV
jgi:hypothetical protein